MSYDKTEMNAFVQSLYDAKMAECKHGHYETLFHIVHKAIELAALQAAPAQGLTDGELLEWIARQGDEFSVCILQDQPGDGNYFVCGMGTQGQGVTFREACIAAIQKGQQS